MPVDLKLFDSKVTENIGEYDIVVKLHTDVVNEIVRDMTGAQRRPLASLSPAALTAILDT